MTDLVFTAMPAKEAEAFRAGAADAYGNPPEKAVSRAACRAAIAFPRLMKAKEC